MERLNPCTYTPDFWIIVLHCDEYRVLSTFVDSSWRLSTVIVSLNELDNLYTITTKSGSIITAYKHNNRYTVSMLGCPLHNSQRSYTMKELKAHLK